MESKELYIEANRRTETDEFLRGGTRDSMVIFFALVLVMVHLHALLFFIAPRLVGFCPLWNVWGWLALCLSFFLSGLEWAILIHHMLLFSAGISCSSSKQKSSRNSFNNSSSSSLREREREEYGWTHLPAIVTTVRKAREERHEERWQGLWAQGLTQARNYLWGCLSIDDSARVRGQVETLSPIIVGMSLCQKFSSILWFPTHNSGLVWLITIWATLSAWCLPLVQSLPLSFFSAPRQHFPSSSFIPAYFSFCIGPNKLLCPVSHPEKTVVLPLSIFELGQVFLETTCVGLAVGSWRRGTTLRLGSMITKGARNEGEGMTFGFSVCTAKLLVIDQLGSWCSWW